MTKRLIQQTGEARDLACHPCYKRQVIYTLHHGDY